jgi:O-antigen ligase
MIRVTIFFIFLSFLCLYSFKDWYKSLCALIVLIAVIEHPDVPKTLLGIQGFSPWNILLSFVLLGWLFNKKKENLTWNIPGSFKFLLFIYISLCIVSYLRMSGDTYLLVEWEYLLTGHSEITQKGLFAEHFINTIKWIIPGFLIYHGCNSQERFDLAIKSVLLVYIVLALLVIKTMPIGSLTSGDRLQYLALKLISNNVGFHRVNLAMMLSGAFWAVFSYREYILNDKNKKYIYIFLLIILYALALTGGRTGYITLCAVGLILSILVWRRLLVYAPILISLVIFLVPAARDRLFMGFDEDSVDYGSEELYKDNLASFDSDVDIYTVTSGRTVAWPFVIEKISNNLLLGYGKEAMIRTEISKLLFDTYNESFPHPHNMYLQWILDNGILGFIPVAIFYFIIIKYSLALLFDRRNRIFVTAGGVSFSLVSALLLAGFGSQTFYPREGALPMWIAIFLMLRIFVLRKQFHNKKDIEINEISDASFWEQGTVKKT